MSKHTPGPWNVHDQTDIMAERGGDQELIASAYGFYQDGDTAKYKDTDETSANARLICAAPDMLEALLDCQLAFSGQNLKTQQARALMAQAQRKARAAIAKATGAP